MQSISFDFNFDEIETSNSTINQLQTNDQNDQRLDQSITTKNPTNQNAVSIVDQVIQHEDALSPCIVQTGQPQYDVLKETPVDNKPSINSNDPISNSAQGQRLLVDPYDEYIELFAHIVEHDLGWTIRVDRTTPKEPYINFAENTTLEAMMPNYGKSIWSLPRIVIRDLQAYPILLHEEGKTCYHIVMLVQPKRLIGTTYNASSMNSVLDSPIVDAAKMDTSQYVFFSELVRTEWNQHCLVYGEPVDPIVQIVASRFCSMWSMPYPKLPIVLYHGTLADRADEIVSHGFRISSSCRYDGNFAKPTDTMQPIDCTPRVCRCRMLGTGVYGTIFRRALSFAATRFARGHRSQQWRNEKVMLGIVRFAIRPEQYHVQSNSMCECGCQQPFVDHLGRWKRTAPSVMIPNFSLPATKTIEMAVANASDCLVLGCVHYERKYVDRSKDRREPPMDFSRHAKPIESHHARPSDQHDKTRFDHKRSRSPELNRRQDNYSTHASRQTHASRSNQSRHDSVQQNKRSNHSFLSHLEQ